MNSIKNHYPDNREVYFDNIKGLLITLVVFAHCLFEIQENHYLIDNIVDAIYFFHMPAFVFVSGYFSKTKNSKSKISILKLVVAYVLYNGFFAVSYNLFKGTIPHYLRTYTSEWYLIALVLWRLLTPFLSEFKNIIILSTFFSILAGFMPDIGGNSTLAINKVVTFFPFFISGYLLSKNDVYKIQTKSYIKKSLIGLGALFLMILLEIFSHKKFNITDYDLLPNAYRVLGFTEPAARMSIIIVSLLFIIAALHLSPNCKIPLITISGKNSLTIYLLHRPLTMIFAKVFHSCSAKIVILAALLCTLLILTFVGSDFVAKKINVCLNECANVLGHKENVVGSNEKKIKVFLYVSFFIIYIFPIILNIYRKIN